MELINDRKEALPLILDWIKANLTLNEVKEFRREAIAEELNTTSTNVSKTLHIIIQRGYIDYKQRKNVPSTYKLIKDLSGVTVDMVNAWTKEYDRQFLRNKKAAQPGNLENSTPIFEPLKSSYATVEPTTEPVATLAPEAPKSRSQQLLEEAQRLQALAEEEAQREEEEAAKQQATQLPSEQPGTLPDQLMMLDTRIDGNERRLDGLEKEVNVMLYFFQQASFAVRSLGPVSLPVEPIGEPTPAVESTPEPTPTTEPTTRNLLVRLVNSYAAADRKSEHDTWKWLYGQYDLRKGFNVYAQAGPQAKGKDESYLAVVEQQGQIEDLYKLARKLMVLPDLK